MPPARGRAFAPDHGRLHPGAALGEFLARREADRCLLARGPVPLVAGSLGTPERALAPIDAALRKGGRRRRAATEQVRQEVDGVGEVDGHVAVRVCGPRTGRRRSSSEEVQQGEDGVGKVDLAVRVRVPPHEAHSGHEGVVGHA